MHPCSLQHSRVCPYARLCEGEDDAWRACTMGVFQPPLPPGILTSRHRREESGVCLRNSSPMATGRRYAARDLSARGPAPTSSVCGCFHVPLLCVLFGVFWTLGGVSSASECQSWWRVCGRWSGPKVQILLLFQVMLWLGEELDGRSQWAGSPFAPGQTLRLQTTQWPLTKLEVPVVWAS